MKPEGIAKLVEDKYKKCTTDHDRVMVKWIGWLLTFLIMNKGEKRLFVEDDSAIDRTIDELTKDLYGLGRYEKRHTANNIRRIKVNSRGS